MDLLSEYRAKLRTADEAVKIVKDAIIAYENKLK